MPVRQPRPRFVNLNATPPGGWYEYSAGGGTVRSRSRFEIVNLARALRDKEGLPAVPDLFALVMEYMSTYMPPGFCTVPPTERPASVAEVKAATEPLLRMPQVPSDEIERRLSVCYECDRNCTRGYCFDCSGLTQWMAAGFGGRRPRFPLDRHAGVCGVDHTMVSAAATVSGSFAGEYPVGCWKKPEALK